ncbi:hypothetical protein C8F04DRAFT_1314328 [Mycena alexandri]|uniref:Uncharacterized protein n=1 Tax=Mycena alexandri TaxID=1745969 RepID=A0AAD6S6E2_9AGAR|nr:hypothetical protein C8F04DRAFT_1314328 [Mycena alexandri]
MLESLPRFNSYHKYELPAQNLLPRQPKDLAELLDQISQLLFALCFRVEDFVNASNELHGDCPNFNPTVWAFFHEVINLLPRTLNPKDIDEARIDIYQSLHNTERVKSFTFTEQINPGADAPAPLTPLLDDEGMDVGVDVETVVNGNPACEAGEDFSLVQNALAGTNLAEYTIEFVPDESSLPNKGAGGVDGIEEEKKDKEREEGPEEEEEEEAPKPKTRAKAGAKGSKKGKAAKGKKTTAPKKKTAAATAPAKEVAAKTAARASSRLAAKGGGETLHLSASAPPSSKRKPTTLAVASAAPASALAPIKTKSTASAAVPAPAIPTPRVRVPLLEEPTRILLRDQAANAAPALALAHIKTKRAASAAVPTPAIPTPRVKVPLLEEPTRVLLRDTPAYPRPSNSVPPAVPLRVRQLRDSSYQTSTRSRAPSRPPNASARGRLAGVSHDDVAVAAVDAATRAKKRARSEEDGADAAELPAEKRTRVALYSKTWIPLLGAENEDALQQRKAESREAHKRRNKVKRSSLSRRAVIPENETEDERQRREMSEAEPSHIVVNGVRFTLVTE